MARGAKKVAFLAIAESGLLEQKTRLLVESLRTFGGELADSEFWVVRPRPGKPLSATTLDSFLENDVRYLEANLNRCPSNAFANKVYACAYLEELLADSCDTLVFCDSDLVFLSSPGELSVTGRHACALRPVETRGIAQAPFKRWDDCSPYWRLIYKSCGVSPRDLWTVTSSSDSSRKDPFVAYFNTGLVAVKPGRGIFRKWRDNFERILRAPGLVEAMRDKDLLFYLDQSSFSATLLAELGRAEIRILGDRHNYPGSALATDARVGSIEELVSVHYHHLFQDPRLDLRKNKIFGELADWFKSRVPFKGEPERYFRP